MSIFKLRVVATFAVLGWVGITGLPAAAESASKAFDGQWRYQTSCASCHGMDGKGISAFGPALKGNKFVMQVPAAVIIGVIQDGRHNRKKSYPAYSGMPAFYHIRAGEAQALVQYLKGGLQQ